MRWEEVRTNLGSENTPSQRSDRMTIPPSSPPPWNCVGRMDHKVDERIERVDNLKIGNQSWNNIDSFSLIFVFSIQSIKW